MAAAGNDTITRQRRQRDMLIGGDGNDFVDGGQGSDVAFLRRTATTRSIWDPGDGSDIVEGEGGTDTLRVQRRQRRREDRHLGQWQPRARCFATSAT